MRIGHCELTELSKNNVVYNNLTDASKRAMLTASTAARDVVVACEDFNSTGECDDLSFYLLDRQYSREVYNKGSSYLSKVLEECGATYDLYSEDEGVCVTSVITSEILSCKKYRAVHGVLLLAYNGKFYDGVIVYG